MEYWQLQQRQAQPLEIKESLTAARIKAYYEHFNGFADAYCRKAMPKNRQVPVIFHDAINQAVCWFSAM